MKGMMPVRGYRQESGLNYQEVDLKRLLQTITPLTKIGAVCFVAGKLCGILAITAVFIPQLNAFAIPLVICWGGLILTTIIVCSYDHFVVSRRRLDEEERRAAEIQDWLATHPELTEQILSQLQEETATVDRKEKVVSLNSYRR